MREGGKEERKREASMNRISAVSPQREKEMERMKKGHYRMEECVCVRSSHTLRIIYTMHDGRYLTQVFYTSPGL